MEKGFQTKLKEIREARGYKSQQAFADAFGVAQSTVGNWEAGKREPNYDTTIKLANFLRVPIDELLGNDDFAYPPDMCARIGARIKAASFEIGASPETCLAKIGISAQDVKRMVNGAYHFTVSTLSYIAECLNKSVYFFTDDIDEKTPAEADVTFDDFTYAMYGETKDLTEENKNMLLDMARMLKKRQQEGK